MVEPPRADDPASSRRPTFASAALATYGTNLAVAGLSLVNVLIVSRALGPEGRGGVAFLTTMAMFSANLATFGVQEANANIGGARPALRRSLASNSLVLSILFGLFSAGVLVLLIELFPALGGESDPGTRWLAIAAIPILILQALLQLLIQAEYAFFVTNSAWLAPALINVAVNGVLAAMDVITVRTAVATWVSAQLLGTLLVSWYVARRSAGFGRPAAALAREALRFGLKAHAGRVMTVGNYRLDHWLLGSIAGPRELGLYSVAVAWAEALFFLPTALVMVQRPDLVRASRGEAVRQAATIFRMAVLLTVPLTALLILAAPFLCVTLFGDEFRGSIDDLRLLAPGAFGILALKLLGNALTAQRKPMLATASSAISFVALVALAALLIPGLGDRGAAVASTLAYTAGGIAVAVVFTRALGARLEDLVPRRGDLPWFWGKLQEALSRIPLVSRRSGR
jgi:O-antigen/teichoic acid export membrane protein